MNPLIQLKNTNSATSHPAAPFLVYRNVYLGTYSRVSPRRGAVQWLSRGTLSPSPARSVSLPHRSTTCETFIFDFSLVAARLVLLLG